MRGWIKRALTRTLSVKGPRGSVSNVEVSPSEKFVLGVIFAICALFGLIALQIAYLAVLKEWNSEIFAAITGLIGTILGIVLGTKK